MPRGKKVSTSMVITILVLAVFWLALWGIYPALNGGQILQCKIFPLNTPIFSFVVLILFFAYIWYRNKKTPLTKAQKIFFFLFGIILIIGASNTGAFCPY